MLLKATRQTSRLPLCALSAQTALIALAICSATAKLADAQGTAPQASADSSAPVATLRVDVRLVDVLTSVTDASGAPMGGLDAKDFAVFDNGIQQKIALFERQSNVPLNLVLALDTSGSVRKDMDAERGAARDFIRSILRPQDSVSVVEFATDVHQIVPFTNQIRTIQHGLNSLHAGAATALYEAIQKSSRSLEPREGRKVLVLVSDGGDTVDTVTYRQALEAALRADVMIYSLIDVPIEASAGRDIGGEHALITLSGQTGGRYFYIDATGAKASFQKIADDLRTQYLIGYYPDFQRDADVFHRIQVTIPHASGEGYQLRYRAGYYADKSSQTAP